MHCLHDLIAYLIAATFSSAAVTPSCSALRFSISLRVPFCDINSLHAKCRKTCTHDYVRLRKVQENTHPVLPEYYNHITLDKSASM